MLNDYLIGLMLIRKSMNELEQALKNEDLENAATLYMQFTNFFNMYHSLLGKTLERKFNERNNNEWSDIINDE
jgi:hypothetical protein